MLEAGDDPAELGEVASVGHVVDAVLAALGDPSPVGIVENRIASGAAGGRVSQRVESGVHNMKRRAFHETRAGLDEGEVDLVRDLKI